MHEFSSSILRCMNNARPPGALPPLGAVRAFEAAARLGSMQRAAEELRLSPSAVSHRVRELERDLKVRLFDRSPRRIQLTSEGAAFFAVARGTLDTLSTAAAAARATAGQATVRVSALPFFTANWLVPRLARFRSAHPRVQIEVSASNRLVDLDTEAVDVAIRNSRSAPGGLPCRKLLDVRAVPVCAAELKATLQRPQDLAHHTLIRHIGRPQDWPAWLGQAGCAGLEPAGSLTFDNMADALEAAAAGHGVAFGFEPMIWETPLGARLTPAFPDCAPLESTYYVVHRAEPIPPVVSDFLEWLRREAATPRARSK